MQKIAIPVLVILLMDLTVIAFQILQDSAAPVLFHIVLPEQLSVINNILLNFNTMVARFSFFFFFRLKHVVPL